MTVKEALEHDWKEGEKLWEVYFVSNSITEVKPLGIVEAEVKNVARTLSNGLECVSMDLIGDFSHYPGQVMGRNAFLWAMAANDKFGASYGHDQSCSNKFFTKEEAEKRLKVEVAKWNKSIRKYKEGIKNEIATLKKNLKIFEKELEEAEREEEIDYNTLIGFNDPEIYKNGDAYGIKIERDGQELRLMSVFDGGDPLGENLLASPYLNTNLQTVADNKNELISFENTENKECFFWEVSGDEEKSQKNFKDACFHYHDLYGIRGSVLPALDR